MESIVKYLKSLYLRWFKKTPEKTNKGPWSITFDTTTQQGHWEFCVAEGLLNQERVYKNADGFVTAHHDLRVLLLKGLISFEGFNKLQFVLRHYDHEFIFKEKQPD